MRTVAFDGRMGASGDMVLGALLALGGEPDSLAPIESALDLAIDFERRSSHGIGGTDVTVHFDDSDSPHRSFQEVHDVVDAMDIDDRVREDAMEAFRLLGQAEATVHDVSIEDIHFHEVGADDAIADITGSAALLADLEPDRVLAGPVAVGGGEIEMTHGVYPVPSPAVAEIAANSELSLVHGPVETELLTPTGAAILGAMATSVETLPMMRLQEIGYGIGDRSFSSRPNVLRAVVGSTTGSLAKEEIAVLETHVDDATPEVLGHLQERLRAVGARDISIVPMTMKKSRPGHLIKVVVRPVDQERIARILAEETGTLGVRSGAATHRWIAERSIETVQISFDGTDYAVDVKVATDDRANVIDVSAEYEDAVAVANRTNRPVREILRRAESVFETEDTS